MRATSRFVLTAIASLTAALPGHSARAATTQVIYSFAGDEDGEYTDTDLVMDSAGNLYGTSVQGGAYGGGTVWELSPSGNSWTHKILYSFTGGADGGEPYKGVTLDAYGNLYGTAVTGGGGSCEGGCGVAYRLTNNGGTWTQSIIHTFTGGDDGSGPGARLTVTDSGLIFGMAPTGGQYGCGTIYEIYPHHRGLKFRVIHAFNGTDGIGGSAGALVLHNDTLYGAATAGGVYGDGTIYQITRNSNSHWKFSVIYNFKGEPDAGFPYGGLMFDGLGNIYGTTYYDGANDVGAVYELSPTDKREWKERLLYSFKEGGGDGNSSIANLVSDTAGNLYGTTSEGGTAGKGVIFALTPGARHGWSESVVHSFAGPPDGAFAYNGMVGDGAGNFYGATVHGGADDEGAIYKFTP